jgi:hypothetical protein
MKLPFVELQIDLVNDSTLVQELAICLKRQLANPGVTTFMDP